MSLGICVEDFPFVSLNKCCQEKDKVASRIPSAHAVVRRSWVVILFFVLVYHTPVVFSPVITSTDGFSLEALQKGKSDDLMTGVVNMIFFSV